MAYKLTIIAELKQWLLDDERNNVIGIVHNSKSCFYDNGEILTLMNIASMTLYLASAEMEEHFLVRKQMGAGYFLLKSSERKNED